METSKRHESIQWGNDYFWPRKKKTFFMKKVAFWLGFEGQIQINIEWGEKEWEVNGWNK